MAISYFLNASMTNRQVANANTTLFTMPAAPSTAVGQNLRIRFANTTNAGATLTVYNVASGGAAGAANEIVPGITVAANTSYDTYLGPMQPGDFIVAISGTNNAITATPLGGTFNS